jgi:hypothetical protein
LRGSDLELLVRRRPSVALRMMAKLSERVRESNRRLGELAGEHEAHPVFSPVPTSQGIEAWAVLFHEPSGRLFPLRSVGDTSLGRHDPVTGVTPDVDLSAIDPERTVSRRHATIRAMEGSLTVREINADTNGTFVNAVKLAPFEAQLLASGDILQLAMVTLRVQVVSGAG